MLRSILSFIDKYGIIFTTVSGTKWIKICQLIFKDGLEWKKMFFNKNIVLEILKSNFTDEIGMCVGNFVASLDDLELESIFELAVDFAALYGIEEMEVEDYTVEEKDEGQNVKGTFEGRASVDGYERINGEIVYMDSGIIHFEVNFSFYVENRKYSDIELECLY